ncbi:hypothetical protein [Campylobacter corcagiensis]|uniref:Uncharacterized protein n=1 Tax=Campylobacter corcagiensis TaxID=1448857 RepID=A0A7M1LGK0_9BACT|nr:hypothetical protein [Campylobacter corcagiensis]QKF64682.1 putative membrane protein [Campylobacter corcagiensis]QOQ87154.1 hypothetical protein IMC76_08055 [Campylobacter corcagiensis]
MFLKQKTKGLDTVARIYESLVILSIISFLYTILVKQGVKMRSAMISSAIDGKIDLTISDIIIIFSIFVLLPIAIFFVIVKISKIRNKNSEIEKRKNTLDSLIEKANSKEKYYNEKLEEFEEYKNKKLKEIEEYFKQENLRIAIKQKELEILENQGFKDLINLINKLNEKDKEIIISETKIKILKEYTK